jgi:hypothetical protein
MKQILRSQDRGHANHGWLDSYHSFSFADYYNPSLMGFRSLRVINEDRVAGGGGFPLHPHHDMEIITYMVDGTLAHRDTMGNNAVIKVGEVQQMSAGTGLRHSEFNPSPDKGAHLLQIWIMPSKHGVQPTYDQKSFVESLEKTSLVLAVSGDGREGSIRINQDAEMWIARPGKGERLEFPLRAERGAWVQVVRGEVEIDGETLKAGDAYAVTEVNALAFQALENSEMLIFDLA